MNRFIVLFFGFLFVGFYELSGGTQFNPEKAREDAINARLDRDAARIATRATPATAPIQQATMETGSDTAQTSRVSSEQTSTDDVTQNSLNLVSFASIVDPEPLEQVQTNVPTETPLADLAETAAAQPAPLSIASLAPETTGSANVAFSGNSLVASSIAPNDERDIRAIKGSLVNMRSGPGTDYDVVDQLRQSTRVEILTDTGNGWVELRPVEGGTTGWIAEFLLTSG